MADPSLEHARLACSLGMAPSAGGGAQPGVALESELSSREKRIVDKAVAAALGKLPSGPRKPEGEQSNRQKKVADRNSRGRLPEGKRCSSGTCNFDHDAKHPGKPCFSDPRVEII
eukprot:3184970-Prymnesium_polylepis.1